MSCYEPLISYSQQVIDAADADGLLSTQLASRLMDDHSTSLHQMEMDGYTGHCRDAAALLEWLGY
jgi:hypothetical protein